MNESCWKDPAHADQWWLYTAGPKSLIHEIGSRIEQGKCVALDEPFPDERLLQCISYQITKKMTTGYCVETLDVPSCEDEESFAEFLGRYKPSWIPSPLDPMGDLAAKNILSGRVFLILMKEGQEWLPDAIRHYAGKCTKESGQIVIFCRDAEEFFQGSKVNVLRKSDYISAYDTRYFAFLCLKNLGFGIEKKQYIADLCGRIAGVDGILCEKLASRSLFENPETYCKHLGIPLEESTVWGAQITAVLPLIENIRRYFIRKYREDLERILSRNMNDDFGKILTVPEDMELRHIRYHYVDNGGMRDASDEDLFNLAYNARNELSHMKILTADVLESLFRVKV